MYKDQTTKMVAEHLKDLVEKLEKGEVLCLTFHHNRAIVEDDPIQGEDGNHYVTSHPAPEFLFAGSFKDVKDEE